MNTDRQAVKAIAEAIAKAARTINDENNKYYVNNQIKNHGGSGGSSGGGGGGSISGNVPASRVTGLYNVVAGYIVNAQQKASSGDGTAIRIIGALGDITQSKISTITINPEQIVDLDVGVANIIHAAAESAEISQLKTDIADMGMANIGTAKIDYAQIKDVAADTSIFSEGVGNKLYIDRLSVTDANIVSLKAGELMLKNAKGEMVRIVIDQAGNVSGEKVDFEGDDILSNSSLSGTRLIENTITTRELNVSQIFANNAVISAIQSNVINTESLFVGEAFARKLATSIIESPNLGSSYDVGTNLNISQNSSITLTKGLIDLLIDENGTTTTELRLTDKMISAVTNQIDWSADEINLSANRSIINTVTSTVREQMVYVLEIISSSDILSQSVQSSTLTARIFKGDAEKTSELPATRFSWKRISGDSSADTIWNNQSSHQGTKSITITIADVANSATFQCVYTEDNVQKAIASKAIIDSSDGNIVSAYLSSNQPITQIYDPNNESYMPDWEDTNLVITPTVLDGSTEISLSDTNLSITWKRKIGATESNLITGETVSGKVLTVSKNVLADISSGMISYVAYVSYVRGGNTSYPITTDANITYSLVKTALEQTAKMVTIVGEQAFKYSSATHEFSPEYIHLEAIEQGCTVANWYYYNSTSNMWVEYPSNLPNRTRENNELYVGYADQVFNGDIATIRVTTNLNNIYDEFSVYKLYDGPKGDTGAGYTVFLTNENITFSGDKNGMVSPTSINCNVVAYDGTQKVTPTVGAIGGAPTGMTVTKLSATNNEIPIQLQILQASDLGGAGQRFGALTVPITYPVETNLSITWSKVNTGADGAKGDSAVTFMVYSTNGTVFTNQSGDIFLRAVAYSGSTDITDTIDVSLQWQKLVSGSWTNLTGETTKSLTVNGSTVLGTAVFRCVMTCKQQTYTDLITLIDKTDPIQTVIESSGGDIFKNASGVSTLTCRLFQNAQEIDSAGNLYTCYWYKLDENGDPVDWDRQGQKIRRIAGKSIQITGSDVDNKTTFICEVFNQADTSGTVAVSAGQYTITDIFDPVQQDIAPTNPVEGMIWIDTSVTPNIWKRWTGTEWVHVGDADMSGIEEQITTIETKIEEQDGQISLRATKEELSEVDGRVTSVSDEVAEINTRYDSISLAVASKSSNYRQATQPTNPNAGDIWVQPIINQDGSVTEKQYQALGAVGSDAPIFAYDDEGNLVYSYLESAKTQSELTVNDSGDLQVNAEGTYSINSNGELVGQAVWKELYSDDLAALVVTVNGINTVVANHTGSISAVTQQADKIDWLVASGSSQSQVIMTDNAMEAISDNVVIKASNQITASAANGIDLSSNNTVRITAASQISATALGDIDLSANDSIHIYAANQIDIDALEELNLSSNTSITLAIRSEVEEQTKSMQLRSDGLHIGTAQKSEEGEYEFTGNQVVITDNSVDIRISETTYSQFGQNYVQFGNYQLRQSSDGGLVFKMV